jgi:hypothetical protein
MLVAWQSPVTRPTRDIDLLGRMSNSVDEVTEAMREVAAIPYPEDALRFDPESVRGERITEGAGYTGVRVRFVGYLGKARIPMQIDVGFGDTLVPGPTPVQLPSVLDLAPATLQGYTRESAIAEKLQAMLALGEINSRMKDYYDIWLLATRYAFTGPTLNAAIEATLERRGTPIALPAPGLEPSFADERHETQWRAFLGRNLIERPATLGEAIAVIDAFLLPVLVALSKGDHPPQDWPPGGPWQ